TNTEGWLRLPIGGERTGLKPPATAAKGGREARGAVFVRVVAGANYGEGRAPHLGSGGMALAVAAPSGDPPREGSSIDVEFLVPGSDARLSVRGSVKWVDENAAHLTSPHRFAFGICFADLRPNDRAVLGRYIVDYRPRVAVVHATAAEGALCRRALEPDVELHTASSQQELGGLLSRGDVYVVLVFGKDEASALHAVESVAGRAAEGGPPIEAAGLGERPRIV